MNRLLGFAAETSLKAGGSPYRGTASRATSAAMVIPARIARRTTYGCGGVDWHTNSLCCRFWQPGGDIVVCCPREGSGPCETYPGLLSRR
jgi:hypothetical protein